MNVIGRRSNAAGKDWIDYSPELFEDAVEILGIQFAMLPDGRIATAYLDECGGQRMGVTGERSISALIYHRLNMETK